jgi:hypothetical protein
MASVINLSGLLSEDLILYNKIMNAYYDRMNAISASASITCNIIFDNIELKNSNNCTVNIINKCFTNSYLSLNTLLETIIDNLEFISNDIRNRIEKNLGIVLDKTKDQRNKGFMKRCSVNADVSNSVNIKKLTVNGCNSKQPLMFNFYNTGDAKANCGIVELLNALSNKVENEQEVLSSKFDFILNKVFNLTLKDYLFISLLLFLILLVILVVTNMIIRSPIIFKYKTGLNIIEKKIV